MGAEKILPWLKKADTVKKEEQHIEIREDAKPLDLFEKLASYREDLVKFYEERDSRDKDKDKGIVEDRQADDGTKIYKPLKCLFTCGENESTVEDTKIYKFEDYLKEDSQNSEPLNNDEHKTSVAVEVEKPKELTYMGAYKRYVELNSMREDLNNIVGIKNMKYMEEPKPGTIIKSFIVPGKLDFYGVTYVTDMEKAKMTPIEITKEDLEK